MIALAMSLLLAGSPAIPVGVNPRLELVSTIFRLAGNGEFNSAPDYPYVQRVEAHFRKFADHPTIKFVDELKAKYSIGFDRAASFAAHIHPTKWQWRVKDADLAKTLHSKFPPEAAREFLKRVAQFSKDTKADEFYMREKEFFQKVDESFAKLLARKPYRKWIDGVFGSQSGNSFQGMPGLLLGGSNYGMSVKFPNGSIFICPMIGVWQVDKEGMPAFDASDSGTVVHEFCHVFTNPMIDAHAAKLQATGDLLYAPRKALFHAQAYTSGRIVLYETMVRAGTIMAARELDTPKAAAAAEEEEHRRGFLWAGELASLMQKLRNENPGKPLSAFMPQVVDFMNKVPPTMEARLAALPKIIKTTPANGSTVKADVAEMVIEFSEPMDTARRGTSGLPLGQWPDGTAKARWSEDGKTLRFPLKLDAGKKYEITVGDLWNPSYRSAKAGQPLEPVLVAFSVEGTK